MIRKTLIGIATTSLLLTTNAVANGTNKIDKSMKIQMMKYHHQQLINDVIKAVSKTGISAVQTKKIADGISEYKTTMNRIKHMKIFPIDSFIGDEFDEKIFISKMSEKSQAKIAAKAALFKYIFAVLDDNQRKIFKREYAAPLIEKIIRMNMNKK